MRAAFASSRKVIPFAAASRRISSAANFPGPAEAASRESVRVCAAKADAARPHSSTPSKAVVCFMVTEKLDSLSESRLRAGALDLGFVNGAGFPVARHLHIGG